MTDDDACSAVKADLESGTYTHYTTNFPIYIKDHNRFQGGNVYIILSDCLRTPIQTVNGTILFTPRSCSLQIVANTPSNRDDLYDDVISILTSTSRGYTIKRGKDLPYDEKHHSLTLQLSFLL